MCACVVFAALRVAVQSPGRRLFPPPHTWKKSAQVPGVVCYPPLLERRMQGVPLYCSGWWLDVLLGKQPAYTRAVPRVLRQSERVLPSWLWSPSGGVPNMAGSRTARSPVASAPFPARGLHPSTPSRPARGVTSGRESAFPHPVLGLVWLFGEPTCCVCLAWWLFPRSGTGSSLCTCAGRRKAEARSLREVWGRGGWGGARGFLAAGSRVRGSGCALSGAVRGWRRAPICGRPSLWAARRCPGLLWVRSRFREGLAPSPGAGGISS